jgi:hypothetical protein
MDGGSFNPDDLVVLPWQYTIVYHDTSSFRIGDLVFLKSNPEFPMTVVDVTDMYVYTMWMNKQGEYQQHGFIPQIVLQYRYACFVTGKRKFHLCLN